MYFSRSRFLFVAENGISSVKYFIINEDGTLEDTRKTYGAPYATNIGFMVFDEVTE